MYIHRFQSIVKCHFHLYYYNEQYINDCKYGIDFDLKYYESLFSLGAHVGKQQ